MFNCRLESTFWIRGRPASNSLIYCRNRQLCYCAIHSEFIYLFFLTENFRVKNLVPTFHCIRYTYKWENTCYVAKKFKKEIVERVNSVFSHHMPLFWRRGLIFHKNFTFELLTREKKQLHLMLTFVLIIKKHEQEVKDTSLIGNFCIHSDDDKWQTVYTKNNLYKNRCKTNI